jgi:hypothetical protein
MEQPHQQPPNDFPPPGGGYVPPGANGTGGPPDLSALVAILDALRRAIPVELQEQFNTLQRELLLTLRALIDWYLERLDKPELAPKVEDIPID